MDFLQVGNYGAAKDVVALLAVMLEQAVLDGGRFEVAQVLTLQEDVPYTVFSARQGSVARRAFAPLADQRWVTVALAYLKELETISSKRVEMLSSQNFCSWWRSKQPNGPRPKAEGSREEKAEERSRRSRRRRGSRVKYEGQVGIPGFELIDAKIDFTTWALCLPRWVMAARLLDGL